MTGREHLSEEVEAINRRHTSALVQSIANFVEIAEPRQQLRDYMQWTRHVDYGAIPGAERLYTLPHSRPWPEAAPEVTLQGEADSTYVFFAGQREAARAAAHGEQTDGIGGILRLGEIATFKTPADQMTAHQIVITGTPQWEKVFKIGRDGLTHSFIGVPTWEQGEEYVHSEEVALAEDRVSNFGGDYLHYNWGLASREELLGLHEGLGMALPCRQETYARLLSELKTQAF